MLQELCHLIEFFYESVCRWPVPGRLPRPRSAAARSLPLSGGASAAWLHGESFARVSARWRWRPVRRGWRKGSAGGGPAFKSLTNQIRCAVPPRRRCGALPVASCPAHGRFPPVRRGLFGRLKPVVGLRNSAFREPERPVWQGRTARLACLSGASGRIAWRRRMLSCWQTARWLLPPVAPAFAAMGSACCRFAILGRDNRLAAGGAAAADVPAVQCYFA